MIVLLNTEIKKGTYLLPIFHNLRLHTTVASVSSTGFPKKAARFSILKNIPDLLSDDRESKMLNTVFHYSSNRASFMGNPLV